MKRLTKLDAPNPTLGVVETTYLNDEQDNRMILVKMHWIDTLKNARLRRRLDRLRGRCTRGRHDRRHVERARTGGSGMVVVVDVENRRTHPTKGQPQNIKRMKRNNSVYPRLTYTVVSIPANGPSSKPRTF